MAKAFGVEARPGVAEWTGDESSVTETGTAIGGMLAGNTGGGVGQGGEGDNAGADLADATSSTLGFGGKARRPGGRPPRSRPATGTGSG